MKKNKQGIKDFTNHKNTRDETSNEVCTKHTWRTLTKNTLTVRDEDVMVKCTKCGDVTMEYFKTKNFNVNFVNLNS